MLESLFYFMLCLSQKMYSQCANMNVADYHIVSEEEIVFYAKVLRLTQWYSVSVYKLRKLHNGEKYR